ncbi:MAG: exosortase W [Desulfobacterales bacterium]
MPTTRLAPYFPVYVRLASFFLAFAAAFAVLYHSAVVHIVRSWTTPDGSHGILILGISIYLVWIKKDELLKLRPDPALLPGGILLGAGCFAYFAGVISSTLLVQVISMVPVLLGAILLFAGFSFFWIFLLPVGYLIFLTGFVEQLLGGFAIYFQQFAAWFAGGVFRLLGMPVFQDYTIIQLPHITLEVVRACSGVGHLVALFALAVPLAFLTQRTWTRKSIIVFSAFIIGLLANGLRIVLIGLFTKFFPGAGVHGPYETFQVAVIFFFGLVLLLVLSSLLAKKDGKDNPANPNNPSSAGDENDQGATRGQHPCISTESFSVTRQYCSFVLGILIFAATFGFVHFYTPQAVALENSLSKLPGNIQGYTGSEIEDVSDSLRPFPAHNELFRRYENGAGQTATLYIGYFKIQNRRQKIIDYRREWMHQESTKTMVSNGQNTFEINKTSFRDQGKQKDVYFWYSMNGRIIRNQYVGKAMTFLNALFTRTTNAAVIVVATPNDQEEMQPFLAGLVDAVQNHLSGI